MNKWLKELADKKETQIQTPPSTETPLDKLEKLAKLHQMGALSDEEFNSEKQKLLASNSL
ncbi:MAG: SHOCT domain-containing protein [Treponema sp.]